MVTKQYPEHCESDFEYVRGRCETPPYLIPKPPNFKGKFECPTIITTNPDELHSVNQEFPKDFYNFLKDMPRHKEEEKEELNIRESEEPAVEAEPIPQKVPTEKSRYSD
jgi:hypothetical protein